MWFWRTAQGDEVDLLLETAPEQFVAIECKTSERVDTGALTGIRKLAEEYGATAVAAAHTHIPRCHSAGRRSVQRHRKRSRKRKIVSAIAMSALAMFLLVMFGLTGSCGGGPADRSNTLLPSSSLAAASRPPA